MRRRWFESSTLSHDLLLNLNCFDNRAIVFLTQRDSPAQRRRLPTSTAEQQVRLVLVIAEFEARDSFQGKRRRYAVIGGADAALADAKRQGRRPAPEIAIERIVLFLQRAVARLEAMLQASGPVLAEAIVETAQEGVVSGIRPQRRVAAQITLANRPAPRAVRGQSERVIRLTPLPVLDAVAGFGIERNPRTRLEVEVGVNVRERSLVRARFEAPIGVNGPLEQVLDPVLSFGLQRVSQAEPKNVLAVDGINRIVVWKIDR